MKKLIVIIAFMVLAGFYVSKAYCWNCAPKRCMFDTSCGIGCWCYKGAYDLYGVCVTE
jgi:hypothetical protein